MTRWLSEGVTRVILAGIWLYRSARLGRPPVCRFTPSCSAYAAEAVQVHGPVRGSWLAIRRLSRCHPWGGLGPDPVPDGPPSHRGVLRAR